MFSDALLFLSLYTTRLTASPCFYSARRKRKQQKKRLSLICIHIYLIERLPHTLTQSSLKLETFSYHLLSIINKQYCNDEHNTLSVQTSTILSQQSLQEQQNTITNGARSHNTTR